MHTLRYCILSMLLLAALTPAAPARAAVLLSTQDVSLNVRLGDRATHTLQLGNSSTTAVTPLVFEAYEQPAMRQSAPAAAAPARAPLPDQTAKLDPQLLTKSGDSARDAIVILGEQADLSAAYQISDWGARGAYVYTTLRDHAAQTQADLRADLQQRGVAHTALWVVNALLVSAPPAELQRLSARADVALVRADVLASLPASTSAQPATISGCSPDQPANPICWGIRTTGADRVWQEFGVDGAGITVATIDTGAYLEHPALAASYRGAAQIPGAEPDHRYNWYSPQRVAVPFDTNGHGSHVLGILAGGGGASVDQPAIGVAPGADWIAAQGCQFQSCANSDLLLAAQWLLAPTLPDGSAARPDLRPMIISNSWSGDTGDLWFSGFAAAWRAAGIFPVFAAGNAGPDRPQICGSVGSPSDYASVFAVGATDQSDTIAAFSLFGPAADGRTKPDVVAPGVAIISAGLSARQPYRMLQGTSMAAPHVAGVVALLWSANPTLIGDYETTAALLRARALRRVDLRCGGVAGEANNIYGAGRVQAYTSVAAARVDVPWLSIAPAPTLAAGASGGVTITLAGDRVPGPGTYRARVQVYEDLSRAPSTIQITMHVQNRPDAVHLSGQVVSAAGGGPLAATVGIVGGLARSTDTDGHYALTLAPGRVDLLVKAAGYAPAQVSLDLAPGAVQRTFALAAVGPQIALSAAPAPFLTSVGRRGTTELTLSNPGTTRLAYRIEVPLDQYGIWRSDEQHPLRPVYEWVDLPADARELALSDQALSRGIALPFDLPFFGGVRNEVLVASDGMLFFDRFTNYRGVVSSCLPANDTPFDVVAPLRVDLDPSAGGRVRVGSATVAGEPRFVISYEDIPLQDATALTATFQVLLAPDGTITFQYRDLPVLPEATSVGIQRSPTAFVDIGCGARVPLTAGLAIAFRPQPVPTWLSTDHSEGELAAGASRQIRATVAWTRPDPRALYRARLRVISNDPSAQPATVIIEQQPRVSAAIIALPRIGR